MNLAAVTALARQVRFGAVLIALVTGVFYWPAWTVGRLLFCIVWAAGAIWEGLIAGIRPENGNDGPDSRE